MDAQEFNVIHPLYLFPMNVKRVHDDLLGVQEKVVAPSYQVLDLLSEVRLVILLFTFRFVVDGNLLIALSPCTGMCICVCA